MRRTLSLIVLFACAPATGKTVQPSMVSGWADGPDAPTCSEKRSIGWVEYAGSAEPRNFVVSIDVWCDERGIELGEAHASGAGFTYPLDPGSFGRMWKSAVAAVNESECYTREEARAGRHLPPSSMTVSLGKGSSAIGCAPGSPPWSAVVADVQRLAAEARARFPGPLQTCCASKPPCGAPDEVGKSCW